MMPPDFITEHYKKQKLEPTRWRFEPIPWMQPTPEYRYFLTYMMHERRFSLSRQKVAPVDAIDDAAQIEAFRTLLADDEIAECMRLSILTPPPEEESIPF